MTGTHVREPNFRRAHEQTVPGEVYGEYVGVPRSSEVGYTSPIVSRSSHHWRGPVRAAIETCGEHAAVRELVGEEKKVQGPVWKCQ